MSKEIKLLSEAPVTNKLLQAAKGALSAQLLSAPHTCISRATLRAGVESTKQKKGQTNGLQAHVKALEIPYRSDPTAHGLFKGLSFTLAGSSIVHSSTCFDLAFLRCIHSLLSLHHFLPGISVVTLKQKQAMVATIWLNTAVSRRTILPNSTRVPLTATKSRSVIQSVAPQEFCQICRPKRKQMEAVRVT